MLICIDMFIDFDQQALLYVVYSFSYRVLSFDVYDRYGVLRVYFISKATVVYIIQYR